MGRRSPAPPGVVTWGWYSVTEGASETVGGAKPGLVLRERSECAFWAAWWTEDPRLRPEADPDAHGFYTGPKAAFFAGAEAESCIRREKSSRAYVLAIAESFARGAYREGAPRLRSSATDFEEVAAAWCDERGIPRTAVVEVVKAAWRAYLKAVHPDQAEQVGPLDLEAEKRRYEAALAVAEARAVGQRREAQRETIAAGERPVDHAANDRATIKTAKSIAATTRARLEAIARHLGVGETLAGLCHFAALGLVEALREEGLRAVVASSGGHSWATVLLEAADEPLLVDITATQYGLARVYVRLPRQARRWPYDAARVRGERARAPAQEVADEVIVRAPERWWSIEAKEMAAACRSSRTALTKRGRQTMRRDAPTTTQEPRGRTEVPHGV